MAQEGGALNWHCDAAASSGAEAQKRDASYCGCGSTNEPAIDGALLRHEAVVCLYKVRVAAPNLIGGETSSVADALETLFVGVAGVKNSTICVREHNDRLEGVLNDDGANEGFFSGPGIWRRNWGFQTRRLRCK